MIVVQYKDLTNKFNLEEIVSDELDSLLLNEFSKSRMGQGIKYGDVFNPKKITVIFYGSKKDFRVTYKSSTREVMKIEASLELEDVYCNKICELINELLVNKKGEEEFMKVPLYSNYPFKSPLISYKDLFTVKRVPDGFPVPIQMAADHPLLLEFKYIRMNQEDSPNAHFINSVRRLQIYDEIVHLISVLTEGNIYKHKKRDYEGSDNFVPAEDSSEVIDQYPYLNNRLIDIYFNLNKAEKQKFSLGCYWYYQATISNNKTNKYLNFITAIEIFMEETRNSNVYSVLKKLWQENKDILHLSLQQQNFSNKEILPFIKNFNEIMNNWDLNQKTITKEFRRLLKDYAGINVTGIQDRIYDLRSRCSHQGKVIENENKQFSVRLEEDFAESELVSFVNYVCHKFLIGWLEKSKNPNYKPQVLNWRDVIERRMNLEHKSWYTVDPKKRFSKGKS